jgi:hypothetical protein
LTATVSRRRHALLGTACALGLMVAPFAGSAVVVAVTAAPQPDPPPAQIAAPPERAPVAIPAPARESRRARVAR